MGRTNVRKPVRPGSTATKMAKAADVEKLIKRENERHARKVSNLNEQAIAAQGITSDGRQKVTITRIAGDREEETVRHKQKLTDLADRLHKVWR